VTTVTIELSGDPATTASARRKAAKSGVAMPDGSFPIPDVAHVRKAIRAFGRANPSKRGAVKAHIKKRARALGVSNLIPDGW
jgi:hypothetical protein